MVDAVISAVLDDDSLDLGFLRNAPRQRELAMIVQFTDIPTVLQCVVPFEKIGEGHDLRQFSVPVEVTDHSVLPRMQLIGNGEKRSSVKIYSHLRPPVSQLMVFFNISSILLFCISIVAKWVDGEVVGTLIGSLSRHTP